MAEIKSTLDLVMEKTKGMTLSPEEKRAQESERLDRLAEGLWRRMGGAGWSVEEFDLARQEAAGTDWPEVSRRFWARLVEDLRPGDDLFDQVRLLAQCERVDPPGLAELKALTDRVGTAMGQDLAALVEAERQALAAAGISGSAVVPRPPAGRTSSEGADLSEISARLDALKPRLLATG